MKRVFDSPRPDHSVGVSPNGKATASKPVIGAFDSSHPRQPTLCVVACGSRLWEDHMSNNFTHGVVEGTVTSLPDFARLCATAFGAPYQDQTTAPPQTPTVSERWVENVERDREALAATERWSEEDAAFLAERQHTQNVRYAEDDYTDAVTKHGRITGLLAQVEAWEPPDGHTALKAFMIDKLEVERRWIGEPNRREVAPLLTGAEYKAQAIELARAALERSEQSLAQEQERVAQAAQWVEDLNTNLAQYEAST